MLKFKMRNLVCAGLAALALCGTASAQRFSTPDKPAEPAKQPDSKPDEHAGHDENRTVDGGGGRFTLPLKLYDEKANAAEVIKRAREEAMKDNRRVLVMWGENRCEFCAYLNELLTTDPQLKQLIETEYVWVKVDIGKFDKNIDLANRYKTPVNDPGNPAQGIKPFGAPALTIVDPKTDEAIAAQGGNAMVNQPMIPPDRVFNREFILNHLMAGRAQPQVSNLLMAEAQAKAKGQGKKVLVYFNIWASDSCKAWNRFVDDPEAATVLGKAFVLRKIDTERHIAGDSLLKRLKGGVGAPPWATVLAGDNTPVPEAGKGLAFDATDTAAAAKWLGDVGGPLFTPTDKETLAKALTKAAAPPAPKEEKKEDAAVKKDDGAQEAKK